MHPPEHKEACEELERRAIRLAMRDGHAISIGLGLEPYADSAYYTLDLGQYHIAFTEKDGVTIRDSGSPGNPLSSTIYDTKQAMPRDYGRIEKELLPFLRKHMVLDDLAGT